MSSRQHVARVLASPLKGVYSTHIDSAQEFGRHWHDTYGFGFLEDGAQEWFSGRGIVRGYPGEVITTNPGEVHDGRPLGPPTRRWRIVYVDVDVMTTFTASERGRRGAEITSPVLADAVLVRILQGLFSRLERWNNRKPHAQPVDSLAFEEALVESCVRLMARHGSTRWSDAPSRDVQQVRERLADDLARVPSLADLARLTELSRYQVPRRLFACSMGIPGFRAAFACSRSAAAPGRRRSASPAIVPAPTSSHSIIRPHRSRERSNASRWPVYRTSSF